MDVLDQKVGERAVWWSLPDPGTPELLRASYRARSFVRHSHDRFALGVIETGGLSFHYRGQAVLAPAGWVNLAFPGEAHTGRAAGAEGWGYRMFYLDPELLLAAARAVDPDHARSPFIAPGAVADPGLAARIGRLHRLCEDPLADPLARQAGLGEVLGLLVQRYGSDCPVPRGDRESRGVGRAEEYLRASFPQAVQLAELAVVSGLNPFRLVRCFTRERGMPPHAFLVQLRLQHAAELLRKGESPAAAAGAAGFADQSHLHRHFLKCFGVTPGAFRRMVCTRDLARK